MKQGDTDAGKGASRKKGGLSRRALLRGGGLLGAGAFAMGMAALSRSPSKSAAGGSGDGASDNAGEESHDAAPRGSSAVSSAQTDGLIVPGDELAQDLLLVLCPERLSCLVYEPSGYLVDQDTVSALPIYSELSSYLGDDSYGSRFELLGKPILAQSDAVLTVSALDAGVDHAVAEKFAECAGLSCLDYSLGVGGWSALLQWVSQAFGVEVSDKVRQCFTLVDAVQDSFADGVQDRFRVLFCKGSRGSIAYGNRTSLAVCQAFAQCDYPELSKVRETCFYLDDADMYGSCPSDLVLFAEKRSCKSYLKTVNNEAKRNFSIWSKTEIDAMDDVLPAVVYECEWIDDLPVLLQCALASIWLAGYLYPSAASVDKTALIDSFNTWLCRRLKPRSRFNAMQQMLDDRPAKTVDEARDARKEYREEKKREMDEFWERNDEANQFSPEKLKDVEELFKKEREKIDRDREETKKALGLE